MAILVTGGTGYIGSHTVVDLLNHDYDVVIVDNYVNSKPEVLNRIYKITGKKPRFYEINVCDEEKLEEVFKGENITDIIHFAGLKSVAESVEKPQLYIDNNIGSSKVLLRLMDKYNVHNPLCASIPLPSNTFHSNSSQQRFSLHHVVEQGPEESNHFLQQQSYQPSQHHHIEQILHII